MGHGYKHGGANPLNFAVKTYPSEVELKADKPKGNTIGVITTTTMTSWVFSATEPKEPEVGMVWISVGTSSNAEFNAIKKNTLQVYPTSAKQYEGGKWENKTAFIYLNGEWVELWDGYYYKSGVGSKVGNWKASYQPGNTSNVITFEEEAIKFDWKSGTYSVMVAFSPIQDLTDVSKLKFRVNGANQNFVVGATTTQYGGSEDSTFAAKTIQEGLSGEKELIVDVSSLTGKYYLAISGHPVSTPSVGYCYDVQEVD